MIGSRTRMAGLAPAALAGALALAPAAGRAQTGAAASDAPAALRPTTEYRGSAALGLALRRLGPTGRVLMIAAHPDDEDTQLLARLAVAEGADVAYLSLTRGEGGQNAIGPHFQEALGIIRTEELLAARRADGALQLFGRAYDFGFSKSAEEAFRHWPRDSVLADVVRAIRRFRPDAIVSVFTGTPRDGHGQHQAAGILAKEGFAAAADPARFPEQAAAGPRPWQARKLYEGGYFRQDSSSTRYPTGEIDPLLGLSYAELAVISRGRHQSQSVGRALPPGPRSTAVNLVATHGLPVTRPERSIFLGVDSTLAMRAATLLGPASAAARILADYDSSAAAARAEFNPFAPDDVIPALVRAVTLLRAAESTLPATAAGRTLGWYLDAEQQDAAAALAAAQQLVLDATSPREQVAPGSVIEVSTSVWNGGKRAVRWQVTADSAVVVAPGQLATRPVRLTAPAAVTEPYYLRSARAGDLYRWPSANGMAGLPFEPPLAVPFALELGGAPLQLQAEVTYRAVSAVTGEARRPVWVVPPVSLRLEPGVAVRPLGAAGPLTIAATIAEETGASSAGEVRLELPPGWSAQPGTVPLQLAPGETRSVRFAVTPPTGLRPGSYQVAGRFRDEAGREYTRGFELIDYPHIRPYPLYTDARTRIEAVDVAVPPELQARPLGYITGPGDGVPAALAQLGLQVEELRAGELGANGVPLARFRTIIVGARAFDTEPELAALNPRLLEWVRTGGTLVVQYQQTVWAERGLAPYPLTMARPADRVTDENAAVTALVPASPLLNRPNRIGERDWEGWVQERGLYFPRSWAPEWQPLLAMADPGEEPQRGALLVARYGQGTVIYTGLAFFRQLPAGVPGAIRLFVNLLAAGV